MTNQIPNPNTKFDLKQQTSKIREAIAGNTTFNKQTMQPMEESQTLTFGIELPDGRSLGEGWTLGF